LGFNVKYTIQIINWLRIAAVPKSAEVGVYSMVINAKNKGNRKSLMLILCRKRL